MQAAFDNLHTMWWTSAMTPAAKCCFVDVCLPYAFHTMVAWRNRHAISTLMVCLQKTWRHLLAVCGADAQRLLAEADARPATHAGAGGALAGDAGAPAAAVSCVKDGTPAGAAADQHTARYAEPDSGGDNAQGLGDPLMVAYVSRKNKTADKISTQLPSIEPHLEPLFQRLTSLGSVYLSQS